MKCKNCGADQAKFPIFKQAEGKKIFLWKNLFKMAIVDFLMVVGVIFLVWGTAVMLEETTEIQKHPCVFCAENGCCSQPLYCYPNNTQLLTPVFDPIEIVK